MDVSRCFHAAYASANWSTAKANFSIICHLSLYDVLSDRGSSGLFNQYMFITLCIEVTSLCRVRRNKYVPITILFKKIGLHSFLQKERGVSNLHCNLIKKMNKKVLIFKINVYIRVIKRSLHIFILFILEIDKVIITSREEYRSLCALNSGLKFVYIKFG